MTFSRVRRIRAPIAFLTNACFLLAMATPWRALAEGTPADIHRDIEGVAQGISQGATSTSAEPLPGPIAGPAPQPGAMAPKTGSPLPVGTVNNSGAIPRSPDQPKPTDKITENAADAIKDSLTDPLTLPGGGDKTGVSSQAISLPQGGGKIQGMGESFSAQLSTGVAMYSIPFALLSARGDAQPSLRLSYSSASGHGLAGVGWEVGVPFIARQTDRGLPQYADPVTGGAWYPGQDRFVFSGGQELIPICLVTTSGSCAGALDGEVMPVWAGGWQYFRPRVEGAFLRFFWSADHSSWRVQDKSGVTMELGGDANALEVNPDLPAQIFQWNLAREYDTHVDATGKPVNVVAYRYLEVGGVAYLSDVYDTPPRAGAGAAPLSSYAHHTHLKYETRPDATFDFHRGWRVTSALRLVRVDVASKTFEGDVASPRELVRRYHLTYDSEFHPSLLVSVQMEGKCLPSNVLESAETLPDGSTCPRLPAMKMGYQHVDAFDAKGAPAAADVAGFEGFDERIHALASSPPNSIDEELTDLFDINSDALPDVLVTAPALFGGQHGVYFNGGAGTADAFKFGTMPVFGVLGADASTISLKNLNLAAGDLDGDGTIDLLHMPRVKTYSVYTPVGSGTSYAWKGRVVTTADSLSPKIDFGKDASNQHLVDVNGDGLVDVVYVAGTEVDTFFSLGRYPGGDGQFGHASWTSATTASLSTDPVRACVPWSGTPVRFSDAEIRLGDMNGDGLTDIVKLQKGNIQYWPGRGNGLWGTGSLTDCPAGSFGSARDIAMTSSPYYTEPDVSALRLDDVNGDGLDDLVEIRFSDVDVWLNIDGIGWTGRHVIVGTPAAPSFANKVRLVDVNGSGLRDILWGDSGNYRYIDLAGGHRPWVLTHVENGLGKSTDLEYASSTDLMLAAARGGNPWATACPTPLQLVVRETETDNLAAVGRPSVPNVTEYAYRDPFFDGRQREFRGFGTVSVTRIGDENSPTATTTSAFLLGECKSEDSKGVDICAPAERWRDNPREGLKGLPVVSDTFAAGGVYLSTVHRSYTLRQLYVGVDGRVVRHPFESATDTYLYDDTPFVPSISKASLSDLVLESKLGVATPEPARTFSLWSTTGRAHTRSRTVVDRFGNETDQVSEGCVEGCVEVDEVITDHNEPGRPAGDSSGWLWRTLETWTAGSLTTEHRHHTIGRHDANGELIETRSELTGTLPLARRHEVSTEAVAPTPATASHDGIIVSSSSSIDEFGSVIFRRGANERCRGITLDGVYAQLPIAETAYAGPTSTSTGCGATPLVTSATYDRGLGLVRRVTDLHGEVAEVQYDGFGRLASMTKPDPTAIGSLSPLSSVKTEYRLPDVTGKPYSLLHTMVQDGASPSEDSYHHAWAYVDGFGRAILTLEQADVLAGDGGDWMATGLTEYDAKSAPRRAYRGWFYSGDATSFPLGVTPPSKYGSQRYDAFGRKFQTFNLDGSVSVANSYHALSTDIWDAADLAPGPHAGTPATVRVDGHGRTVSQLQRFHHGKAIEADETHLRYLPSGEIASATRVHVGSADAPVVRWWRYDSLGRTVLNVEPNTTKGFSADPSADPSGIFGWRYAYDDAGDLVATSDARGCGTNYSYDTAGRLLAEDYSPCLRTHATYSAPDVVAGVGVEVLYRYDVEDPETASIASDDASFACSSDSTTCACPRNLLSGRLSSVSDRGAKSLFCFDGRGRVIATARRVAKPGVASESLSSRYAPHWYTQHASYDGGDRVVRESTGADVSQLLGGDGKSDVITRYTRRGSVRDVSGSYGTLVASTIHDADGLTQEISYGDVASTKTAFEYDGRLRLRSVQTYRGPPAIWTYSVPAYAPAPTYGSGSPSTFQLLLENLDFYYDEVDNPIEIRDWRMASEWSPGAKPVSRRMDYDDLYRLTRIEYRYEAGDDPWTSPFAHENDPSAATDAKLAKPSPHTGFDKRLLWQSFGYDWLGNTTNTGDDAAGFYDRSLGAIANGSSSGVGPYQLVGASNEAKPGARVGHLSAAYDDAGNLKSLAVRRAGPCLPAGALCSQRYVYDWDEVGRLQRARRWDLVDPGTAADAAPSGTPAVDLSYAYDANDERVRKSSADAAGIERHALTVFESLEVRGSAWDPDAGDYVRSALTEVPYLFSQGVRLGRVAYEPADAPSIPTLSSPRLHVFIELADHLGSSSIVLDKDTSELVERSTYQAYGGAETDYRPERWKGFREDHRFTGKEDDVEVGLQYFGRRYYAPLLQRWISADPLAIHGFGADPNVYAYVHGRALMSVDPVGLDGSVLDWIGDKLKQGGDKVAGALDYGKEYVKGVAGKVKDIAVGTVTEDVLKPIDNFAKAAAHGDTVGVLKQVGTYIVKNNPFVKTVIQFGAAVDGTVAVAKSAFKNTDKVAKALANKDYMGAARAGGELHVDVAIIAVTILTVGEAAEGVLGAKPTVAPATETPVPEIPAVPEPMPAAGRCFGAGTLVTTSAGRRPIETIRVGDLVWSQNEFTGDRELRPVLRTFVRNDAAVIDVRVAYADRIDDLRTTASHPFWVLGRGWVPAGDLEADDELLSASSDTARVVAVHPTGTREIVYNLEVADYHTYFVGSFSVLVHNSCTGAGGTPKEGIYEFPDQVGGGTPYVGQSGDIPKRLATHEKAGRLLPGTETTTPIEGGKTAREIAEHTRIQELTGGEPAKGSPNVTNKVDPIGPRRQHLLKDPK
jgi:RHS repeat-associated protein